MTDYKIKYNNLKAKMLQSIDVSYRIGYEQGYKEATQEAQLAQMQQQMQQAQMMQQAAAQQGMPQEEGQMAPDQEQEGAMSGMEGEQPEAEMGAEAGEEPSGELDQYISQLEDMVSKGEKPSVLDLRKKVTELSNLRKVQKEKMKSNKQQIVSAQKSIVDGLIKKWTNKTEETSEDIEKLIREKGIEI